MAYCDNCVYYCHAESRLFFVSYFYCYAGCHYAMCSNNNSGYAEYECRSAECRSAECHYAECFGVLSSSFLATIVRESWSRYNEPFSGVTHAFVQ